MDTAILITQMAELFLMIGLGFVLFRVGLLDVDFNQKMTKVLLYVTVPALILDSVLQQEERLDSVQVATVFAIGFGLYFVFPLLAFVIVKLLRLPLADQGLYMYMLTYGNVGFMGFPVIAALYGSTAVFYTAIINILFNLSCFSVGLVLMHYGKQRTASFDPRTLLSPGIIGCVLSIIIYFADIHFPPVLSESIASVGAITTPLAMILIGATLARMPFRTVFQDWHLYPFTLVKQFAVPLLLWFPLRWLISDTFVLHITFILLLMPVANNSILFATNYGGDETLAAKAVFLTTLVSIVSIPLLAAVCL